MELGVSRIDTDREIGKVSIVGAGMRSHPGVAAKVFQTLADEGINIEMISTSPIKISCVIRSGDVPAGGPGAALGLRARRGRDRARAGAAMSQIVSPGRSKTISGITQVGETRRRNRSASAMSSGRSIFRGTCPDELAHVGVDEPGRATDLMPARELLVHRRV